MKLSIELDENVLVKKDEHSLLSNIPAATLTAAVLISLALLISFLPSGHYRTRSEITELPKPPRHYQAPSARPLPPQDQVALRSC